MAKSSKKELLQSESASVLGPVECLGMTFEDEQARRAYFTDRLREHLADPEFRKIEGFPIGEDEDILAMSDPPYFTACPNPFVQEYLLKDSSGRQSADDYHCEPYSTDVSEGKSDSLYSAHAYHTKVPHKAIIRYILHYTAPGDIVLDGFSGSGMTGVAAQLCGCPDHSLRHEVEAERIRDEQDEPEWGARRVILSDLSPVAAFISSNYNIPINISAFTDVGESLLATLRDQVGHLYETTHSDTQKSGTINYTVWSEVFRCQDCAGEVVFLEHGMDQVTKKVKDSFECPHCSATLTKRSMERVIETRFDTALNKTVSATKRKPVHINYSVAKKKHEKQLDKADLDLLDNESSDLPRPWFPTDRMMHTNEDVERWGDNWRAGTANFSHIHHLYLPRAIHTLSHAWELALSIPDSRNQAFAKFFVEQAIWGMSILARYAPTHFSQVNQYMSGLIRVLSQHAECSPWYILEGKLKRLVKAFAQCRWSGNDAWISTGSCTDLQIPADTVDYIFTDPPFGDNLAYGELNFLIEAWHRVFTNTESEAIMSASQEKGLFEYQDLMRKCFKEYFRVLKPGRWMTIVFHNSKNSVWNAIQEAVRSAGFVIADVRTMDKKQGSFNQVQASGAVKQDLILTAYKPPHDLESAVYEASHIDAGVWEFVDTHLSQLPLFVSKGGRLEVTAERQPFLLFDRMVAFYVQRGLSVPLSAPEFYRGLRERFPERDDMYFLSSQVEEYDKRRLEVDEIEQLHLFVSDEKSAIQWVRQQLYQEPLTYSQLQPLYMKEAQRVWEKHEQPMELQTILEENFVEEQDETWRVPDSKKQSDLEQIRNRALLKEFQQYHDSKGKLKIVRTEALRAGFKEAWQNKDYSTIVQMAKRIPDAVIQEDQALLMYFDNASLMMGE